VKPEKVTAVEVGIEKKGKIFTISANLFAMEFRDEIALTGELSEIGLPLRRNVARSYRRGLEWDAVIKPTASLTVRSSGSVSVARISEWTQFVDVYDAEGNWVDARPQTYSDVRPLLTPPFITQLSADYAVTRFLTLGAAGRYVSRSYLDNTNSNGLEAPSWFRLDASATVDLSRVVPVGNPKLRVSVDNVLDRQSLFASGYSYLYRSQDPSGTETEQGIRYFYPLATRSFQVLLDLGF
jgi:iron complex outermembrane receptor protein